MAGIKKEFTQQSNENNFSRCSYSTKKKEEEEAFRAINTALACACVCMQFNFVSTAATV